MKDAQGCGRVAQRRAHREGGMLLTPFPTSWQVRSPGQLGLDISMFQEIDTYPYGLQAGKCHDKDQDKKTRWRLSTWLTLCLRVLPQSPLSLCLTFSRHSCSLHHIPNNSQPSFTLLPASLNSPLLTSQAVLTPEEFKKLKDIRTVCDFQEASWSILFLKLRFGASFSVLFLFQMKPQMKWGCPGDPPSDQGAALNVAPLPAVKCKYMDDFPFWAIPVQLFPSSFNVNVECQIGSPCAIEMFAQGE